MLLTTILNQCYRFKGFIYGSARFVRHQDRQGIEGLVRPRTGSRALCSGCGVRCAGYDHLPERRFEFIPLWGFPVFLVYARRRVACPDWKCRVGPAQMIEIITIYSKNIVFSAFKISISHSK